MDVEDLRRQVAEKERELRLRENELALLKKELRRAEKTGLPELKSSHPENVWQFKVKVSPTPSSLPTPCK